MRLARLWWIAATITLGLTACEYSGAPEGQPTAPSHSATPAVQPSVDPRAAALEGMREWSQQQLQPRLPGELAGATSSNSTVSFGFTGAAPGGYDMHFICEGPAMAEVSLASQAGAEVLAPLQVPCDGSVLTTRVALAVRGVDFIMTPADGADGRYAFRLVPASPQLSTAVLPGPDGLKAMVHDGRPSAAGPEAQLNGHMDKDGAGCLILQADDGNDYTLIFPEGASFDAETLVLPGGQRLAGGDPVVLKGTRVPADEGLSMCLNYARLLSVDSVRIPS
ncbi:hypothetical protein QF031_003892 [Pseudarthrobacter defluvii]|uniref:hypothetical protein n=1 Tax=Pseudarthrobacter defluvii TaxID=410837 RepID=UPI0027860982|nr:hypothetical protein [Pseudarthrobacter defluvii]MDQ0771143.1 hypothetical protein [Pseudarthrobacter defluvii]